MSNWKIRMESLLAAGQKPSYDELEESLLGALEERKALVATVEARESAIDDMAMWLAKIVTAHIKDDVSGMTDVVREFVQCRVTVKVVPAEQEMH